MVKVLSSAFSFEGWDWKELLLGNWSTVKEVGKFGLSWLFTATFFTANPLIAAPLTIICKQVLDIIHYFLKKKVA